MATGNGGTDKSDLSRTQPAWSLRDKGGNYRPPFFVLVCLVLALSVTWANSALVANPRFEERLELHYRVLANQATTPYQQRMFLIATLSESVHVQLGIPLDWVFVGGFGAGYLFVFLSCWYWFSALFRNSGPILIGFLVVVPYATIMLSCSHHHPADPFGVGLFAISLGLIARNRLWAILPVSLVAGFFWSKQVLIGPIVFLYLWRTRNWRRGALWGLLPVAAAFIGPVTYRLALGYHPGLPQGLIEYHGGIKSLPMSIGRHLVLLGLPILSLMVALRRMKPILLCALTVYPMMIVVYVARHLILFEARSFWICVPVFAAMIATMDEGKLSKSDATEVGPDEQASADG